MYEHRVVVCECLGRGGVGLFGGLGWWPVAEGSSYGDDLSEVVGVVLGKDEEGLEGGCVIPARHWFQITSVLVMYLPMFLVLRTHLKGRYHGCVVGWVT